MNITRNNYEEFFMLYADNELSAADMKLVEEFIASNPDLQPELALFQQFKVSPDETMVFEDKHLLLKPETGSQHIITAANCESFFVLYADNELTVTERTAVEGFVKHHPQWQATFALLQQAKLQADENIVFKNKASLYRKEEDDKVIPFWWRRIAVAAAILLMAGLFWFNQARKTNDGPKIVKTEHSGPAAPASVPVIKDTITTPGIKNEQPVNEIIAVTADKKTNQRVKNIQTVNAGTDADKANNKKQIEPANNHLPEMQEPERNDVALNSNPNDQNVTVPPINNNSEQGKKAETGGDATAAADKSNIDRPVTILQPEVNENAKAKFASQTDDRVEVLNTSVNTKSSLRGLLRKASRMIARKTNNDGNEDSNRKTILIGGFPIVVR